MDPERYAEDEAERLRQERWQETAWDAQRAESNGLGVTSGVTIPIPHTDREEERLWREFVARGYKDSRAYRDYVRSKEKA